MIIGKSSLESDNYDVLVFCSRDAQSVKIPEFIKTIEPYAFNGCNYLRKVEMPKESELQTIEKYAFYCSSISMLKWPSKLIKIGKRAFNCCGNLRKVSLKKTEIRTIEKYAFAKTSINSLSTPSSTVELNEGWCADTSCLVKIKIDFYNPKYTLFDNIFVLGKSSIEHNFYDALVFCVRKIKQIVIPPFIKIFETYSLLYIKFQNTEILENSELQISKENAFSKSSIKNIVIPSNVTKICESVFTKCKKLMRVQILPNSELRVIENNAFSYTSITSFELPFHLVQIGERTFKNCLFLQIVEFNESSNIIFIHESVFENCIHTAIMIPANLRN